MQINKLRVFSAFLILMLVVAYGCDQSLTTGPEDESSDDGIVENTDGVIDGQYIVVMNVNIKGKGNPSSVIESERSEILAENAVAEEKVFSRYDRALQGFAAELTEEEVDRLRADSRIKYIEKDRVISLAPPCGTPNGGDCDDEDDGGDDSGQTTPWGIERVGGATSSNGTAWVIDTGIDLDHPDLNVDTDRSAVFVDRGPGSGSPDDGNGHGTHVAGTIAAIDNDRDVVGVAAGATVVAVKVLDDRGSGSFSGVIEGIDYVASNASAGDVANMSLGGGTSDAVDDAVRNAADEGIYFSIAAGNDGDDANNYSPARVEYNNVWTVSATDIDDVFASFSNWSGPTDPPIEFAAPGVSILSLWADGGTDTISGTSMAAPHVAGLLLVTNGSPGSDGTASNDPDGDPDPIASN